MNREITDSRALFRSAATLIARGLLDLDTQAVPCPCCKRLLSRNSDEWKIYETFAETARKLNDAADRLDNLRTGGGARSTEGYDEAAKLHKTVTTEATRR